MKQAGLQLLAKKAFDRAAALGLLTVSAPVLGVAALAVRTRLGSPVLFRQARAGLGGKRFDIYKLRTMTSARDERGQLLPDRDRMTRLGAVLRRLSVDELPQLLNVLRGDMSLVGPRPLPVEYLPIYTEEQARRHEVLPGITGPVAINGRNARSWDERFALDSWYVDNWSLALDAWILLKTAWAVTRRRGIASEGEVAGEVFRGSGPIHPQRS